MDIRMAPVRLQEVDKPVGVAKILDDIYGILQELAAAPEPKAEPKVAAKVAPKKTKKGKS